MKLFKITSVAAFVLSIAGCASVDTVSRNAPLDVSAFDVEGRVIARSYTIENMTFALLAT